MCAGYELSSAHPTAKHLEDIAAYPQVRDAAKLTGVYSPSHFLIKVKMTRVQLFN